jgi:hypothetical protein
LSWLGGLVLQLRPLAAFSFFSVLIPFLFLFTASFDLIWIPT